MWCLAVIMSVKMKLKYQITNISLSHEYKLAQSIVRNRFFLDFKITIFQPNRSADDFTFGQNFGLESRDNFWFQATYRIICPLPTSDVPVELDTIEEERISGISKVQESTDLTSNTTKTTQNTTSPSTNVSSIFHVTPNRIRVV